MKPWERVLRIAAEHHLDLDQQLLVPIAALDDRDLDILRAVAGRVWDMADNAARSRAHEIEVAGVRSIVEDEGQADGFREAARRQLADWGLHA